MYIFAVGVQHKRGVKAVKKGKTIIRQILRMVRGMIAEKIILALAASAVPLVSLSVLQKIIEKLTGGAVDNTLLVLLSGYILLLLFHTGITHMTAVSDIRLEKKLTLAFSPKILNKLSEVEFSCFENPNFHDTLQHVQGEMQENILNFIKNGIQTLTSLLIVLGLFAFYFKVSVFFAVAFLIILGMVMLFDYKSMHSMNSMINEQTEEERRMNYYEGLLTEKDALFELKIFRAVPIIVNRWRKIAKNILHTRLVKTIKYQRYLALSSLCFLAWIFLLFAALLPGALAGSVSVGLLVAVMKSISLVLNTTEDFSYVVGETIDYGLKLKHLETFFSYPEKRKDGEGEIADMGKVTITFSHVSFAYPGTEKLILDDVSFTIKENEKIALVGANGSGKTTIVKLLCRLYEPDAGEILINGQNLQTLSEKQISDLFSVVFQDYGRYKLSLRENAAMGNLSLLKEEEELKKGLQAAGFKKDCPLDAKIGKIYEDGIELSGGEWQKLAIARANLHGGSFLILDEPTAALDPISEAKMYEEFLNTMQGKGCILISHRLASSHLCDTILLLKDGKVAEQGTYEEMMEKKEDYYRMYEAQRVWYT